MGPLGALLLRVSSPRSALFYSIPQGLLLLNASMNIATLLESICDINLPQGSEMTWKVLCFYFQHSLTAQIPRGVMMQVYILTSPV